MKKLITAILITGCLTGAAISTPDDKKKPKPTAAAKQEADKKAEAQRKAQADKKKQAEQIAAKKKAEAEKAARNAAASRKKSEAKKKPAAKPVDSAAARKKHYQDQYKAAYDKYNAARKDLGAKRAKASDALRKTEDAKRSAERALASIDSEIKRNEWDWSNAEKTYASWKEREKVLDKQRYEAEAALRLRKENSALKQSVYELGREVEQLRQAVASMQKSHSKPKAEAKKAEPKKSK